MKAEDKLSEAKYFLLKLEMISQQLNSYPNQTSLLKNDFMYNLSAFVQARARLLAAAMTSRG